ncbi:MAG: SAM-dependent DNA methyltransferase, partial [Synergistaceae bacterium]|nr:SAM-dependent DNA methyltransferase [Synergistaceae bacterium]
MKKLIATTLIFLQASCASATVWDDFSGYVSNAWNDFTGYVMSWFNDDEKPVIPGDNLPGNIAGNWDRLSGTLNDALTLRDKQETLPDSTWMPFTEDKASNGKKINELLDRALVILSGGNAGNARADAVRLRARISTLRTELDELRNNRITAPESTYMLWRKTKPKIDAEIAEKEREISRTEAEMSSINSRLTEELRGIGLELTEAQTDILLNSVTGEDILQNTIIFDNVRSVVSKLEELSQKDTNTLEITKRYTGMYLVLNDILIHTQEELIRKMDNDYKP